MPTRSDLERTASCYALSLRESRPSPALLRSFQQACSRVRRLCETGAGHYAFEQGSDTQVLVRNRNRPVGWCAARKFLKQAVASDDLWSSVKVTEVSTDAVEARSVASEVLSGSDSSSRGADVAIAVAVGPASSSTAWDQAPPLKQRRLFKRGSLHLAGSAPCCPPQELVPKTLRLLQSDRSTAGAYDFEGSKFSGSGQYGRVESATLTQTNTPVAIKKDSLRRRRKEFENGYRARSIDFARGSRPSKCN